MLDFLGTIGSKSLKKTKLRRQQNTMDSGPVVILVRKGPLGTLAAEGHSYFQCFLVRLGPIFSNLPYMTR